MRVRWPRRGREGEGPPDPAAVLLAADALQLLGPAERWVVHTLPGPHGPPGSGAPRGHRARWWHERVSAVGGVLLLVDTEADPRAVRWAVALVAACGAARERGDTDPVTVARGFPAVVVAAAGVERPAVGSGPTALDSLRTAVRWFEAPGTD